MVHIFTEAIDATSSLARAFEGSVRTSSSAAEKSLSLISALAAFVKVTASTSEGFTSESGEVRSRMSRAVRTAVFPEPAAADRRRSLPRCSIASS